MAPLNAAEFSAEEGVREGQQHGSEANAGRIAVTGRLEYVGYRGLTIGARFWSGRSGFEFRPTFDVPVTVAEIDARYARRRIELRGQFAQVSISNADQLNDALAIRTGVNPNIAQTLRGVFGEGQLPNRFRRAVRRHRALRAVRERRHTAPHAGGYLPIKKFDRDQWVIGATYWPDSDIAVKVDYIIARNRGGVVSSPNSFNLGLGWWF